MNETTIKYKNGAERCPKAGCAGEIMYGSSIKSRLPLGFGFVGGRFQIDSVERRGFGGECMECGKKVFAIKSQRHVVTYPKIGKKRRVR